MKAINDPSLAKLAASPFAEPLDIYRTLFNSIEQGFTLLEVLFDERGEACDIVVRDANEAQQKVDGAKAAIGQRGKTIFPDVAQQWLTRYGAIAKTGQQLQFEDWSEVNQRWYKVSALRVGTAGSPYVAVFYDDITDRKRAEQTLRESEERHRILFDLIDEGYCIIQMLYDQAGRAVDFRYLQVNRAFELNNGLHNAEGKTIKEMAPDIEEKWIDIYNRVAVTGEAIRFEESSAALKRVFSLYAFRIGCPEQRKVAVLFTDITERKKNEEQLKSFNARLEGEVALRSEQIRILEVKQQQEIVRTSLQTLEQERHRIAESLHNGLGQVLYGIKISLAGLLQQQTESEFFNTKTYVSQLLTEAINETRRMSHELMPATLEEFGLSSAVQDICHQLKGQVRFTCDVKTNGKRLEKYMELAVYRTVQELMTNVVKHADAKRATVTIQTDEQRIQLKVSDNGKGISTANPDKSGIGLSSIENKVQLLNGTFKIVSNPGKGTTVEIKIPLTRLG